jgi:hypothetical protein
MTPKEKALEIFNKMCNSVDELLPLDVKQCALIAVDEIIEGVEKAFDEYEEVTGNYVKNRIFYWDFYSDVKAEIYKL